MENNELEYNNDLWLQIEDGLVVIGVKADILEEVSELMGVDLPEEGAEVSPEEVCGEIETDQGPINLYSPIEGNVVESNSALSDDPDMLFDDPTGDGWLIKVEPTDPDDLESFLNEQEQGDTEVEEEE